MTSEEFWAESRRSADAAQDAIVSALVPDAHNCAGRHARDTLKLLYIRLADAGLLGPDCDNLSAFQYCIDSLFARLDPTWTAKFPTARVPRDFSHAKVAEILAGNDILRHAWEFAIAVAVAPYATAALAGEDAEVQPHEIIGQRVREMVQADGTAAPWILFNAPDCATSALASVMPAADLPRMGRRMASVQAEEHGTEAASYRTWNAERAINTSHYYESRAAARRQEGN